MQVTRDLQKRIEQAVRVSMRIEGYRPSPSLPVQARAKALMEQQRVQVSPTKPDNLQPKRQNKPIHPTQNSTSFRD